MNVVPAGMPLGASPRASRSSCGGLEECERRRRAKQGDLRHRHGRAAVDVQHASSRDQSDREQDGADADQRPLRPGESDEGGREDRPDRKRRHREPLEHAEDTREELGRSCPLQERAPGDVEEAAPGTRRRQEDEGSDHRRVPGERPQRDGPHGDALRAAAARGALARRARQSPRFRARRPRRTPRSDTRPRIRRSRASPARARRRGRRAPRSRRIARRARRRGAARPDRGRADGTPRRSPPAGSPPRGVLRSPQGREGRSSGDRLRAQPQP